MEGKELMKMRGAEKYKGMTRGILVILLCGVIGLCNAMEYKGESIDVRDAILQFKKPGKAFADFPMRVHAQYKLVFEYKTTEKGALTFYLRFKDGRSVSHTYSVLPAPTFRRVFLALDGEFRLSDSFYDLKNLELEWKSRSQAELFIRKLRIVPESELAGNAKFQVLPFRKQGKIIHNKNAVRVYFELDNDDLQKEVLRKDVAFSDPCPYAGFRDRVLAGAEELICRVDTPREADVIVYSRALPGAHPEIVNAVKKGARLLLYGRIADPAIEALSPLELLPLGPSRIPKRTKLKIASPDFVWNGESLLDADYGIYDRTRLRSGRALLTTEDGMVFAAQNGKIRHAINGIGNALLENHGFFDRGFLRTLIGDDPAKLRRLDEIGKERDKIERERETVLLKSILGRNAKLSGWRPGVSNGSFGNFGWAVEEGLQCASLLNNLSIENENQFFSFELASSSKQQPIIDWKGKIISGSPKLKFIQGDLVNPLKAWSGEGTVELTAQIKVDPAWKGKSISFYVEKGIDDIDETYFNGHLIGRTDTSVPGYWSVKRRYLIPEKLIHFGEENSLIVRQTNLRADGGFGSRPFLQVEEEDPVALPTLQVSNINWVSKKYLITDRGNRSEVLLSRLSPFTMFTFASNEVMLALEERTAQFAAWPTSDGVKVVRLSGEFYRRERDGAWSAPWLLLFRKNWENGRPVMLVFSHQPESLSARMNGVYINGIKIRSEHSLDQIAAGWPWGIKPVYTGKWEKALPEAVVAHLEKEILPMALKFPVSCDEIFRIDRKKRSIEVLNRFLYEAMQTDWQIPVPEWVALPPMVGFGIQQKLGASTEENLHDFKLFATHGPILGRIGTNTIRYHMPLYDEAGFTPVDVAVAPELHAEIDRGCAGGVRWSWGGGVRYEELDYAWPGSFKRHPLRRTINQSEWLYGLGNALQGFYALNLKNRERIMERVTRRVIAPYEQVQYKLQGRYREEPFSGIRYTINFLSIRALGTKFMQGFGSEIQYGDCNEACTHLAWIAQQLGDRLGYAPWLRANWNALKDSMSFSWVINDYGHMAGSLNDQGSGAWVDMLNGEYAGMMAFARMARIARDVRTEEQALYRAARKALPTILRFRMNEYWKDAWPHSERERDLVCCGFKENKIFTLEFPRTADYNYRVSNELFNFAQGMPGFTSQLYERCIASEVRSYLRNYSRKTLEINGKFIGGGAYLQVFCIFGNGDEPITEWQRQLIIRDKNRIYDWGGMITASQFLPILWRNYGRNAIVESSGIILKEAVYHPDRKELNLELVALESPMIRIASGLKVQTILANGKSITPDFVMDGSFRLRPSKRGNYCFSIKFE